MRDLAGFLMSWLVCLPIFVPSYVAAQPRQRQPIGGPYSHVICSASSEDGINWTRDDGVRIKHASVPCAVADGERVLLYYVDADRGEGMSESVGCAESHDGMNFEKQPFVIEDLPTRKAVDPCVLKDPAGKFRLYYFGSDAGGDPASASQPHEIHLAFSDDGVKFKEAGVAFRHERLVDPTFLFSAARGSCMWPAAER